MESRQDIVQLHLTKQLFLQLTTFTYLGYVLNLLRVLFTDNFKPLLTIQTYTNKT